MENGELRVFVLLRPKYILYEKKYYPIAAFIFSFYDDLL